MLWSRRNIVVGFLILIIGYMFFSSEKTSLSPVAPRAYAQCQLPTQVQGVAVTFPSCVGNVCNFTQGSCTWNSLSGATGYQVIITEVETNTVVQNQQIASGSTTSEVFPVKESNTYRCSVSAINACGTGPAGTASLLCNVQAAVTISPSAPVSTVAPTGVVATAVPATQAPRQLLKAGSSDTLLIAAAGSFVLIVIGMSLFIL